MLHRFFAVAQMILMAGVIQVHRLIHRQLIKVNSVKFGEVPTAPNFFGP